MASAAVSYARQDQTQGLPRDFGDEKSRAISSEEYAQAMERAEFSAATAFSDSLQCPSGTEDLVRSFQEYWKSYSGMDLSRIEAEIRESCTAKETVLCPDRDISDPDFQSNKLLVSWIFPFLDEANLAKCNRVCKSWRIYHISNVTLIQVIQHSGPHATIPRVRNAVASGYMMQPVPYLSAPQVEEDAPIDDADEIDSMWAGPAPHFEPMLADAAIVDEPDILTSCMERVRILIMSILDW
ncbi:MAG TPA: hypothetical protein VLG44_03770 [Chlamydiales bacterium]|nr:hypothetical protein [Chlamydiales bacterium]